MIEIPTTAETEDGEAETVTVAVSSTPAVTDEEELIKKLVVVATPYPFTDPFNTADVVEIPEASIVVTLCVCAEVVNGTIFP